MFKKNGVTYHVGDLAIEVDGGKTVLVVDLVAETEDGWKKPLRKRIPLAVDLFAEIKNVADVAKPSSSAAVR